MSMTDSIADMLTRIRNAATAKRDAVNIPHSKLKEQIANILKMEGYIKDFHVVKDEKQGILRVELIYFDKEQKCVVQGLERISKPGKRVYVKGKEVPQVLGGLGVAILSTNKGVLTDKECRKQNIGGEVLCYIW